MPNHVANTRRALRSPACTVTLAVAACGAAADEPPGGASGSSGTSDGTIAGSTATAGTDDADAGDSSTRGDPPGSSSSGDDSGTSSGGSGTACGPSGGAGGPQGEHELALGGHPAAWMYAPAATGEALPLVVSLHGSGDDAYNFNYQFLVPAQREGFLLVTPEGSDPMGWSPEVDGEIVFAAIDAMKAEHDVDTCRIYVAGFSAGAHYAFFMGLRHADVFAGLGSIQGTIEYAEAVGIWPTMVPRKIAVDIHHGTLDGAYQGAEYSRDVLEAAGHPVHFTALPGVGHETSPEIAQGVWDNLKAHRLDE